MKEKNPLLFPTFSFPSFPLCSCHLSFPPSFHPFLFTSNFPSPLLPLLPFLSLLFLPFSPFVSIYIYLCLESLHHLIKKLDESGMPSVFFFHIPFFLSLQILLLGSQKPRLGKYFINVHSSRPPLSSPFLSVYSFYFIPFRISN